ncbi:MAG: Gfo/Idh/MocA family oxidoreductase [Elusimicrobia bacterium]|nr:Gfo/Idh/MocA family oxidoreductase [Elusimicrobiota bacterium]
MKIIVIGTGSVGKRHLGNLQSLGVKDLAVCDRREDRLKEVAEKFGVKNLYKELNAEALAGATGAVIATPPHIHVPIANKLLEAGISVMIEKPLAHASDGTKPMLELADKKKCFVMTGYTYRFWPPLMKIKELLTQGAIGKIYDVRITFSEYLPDWHPWEDYRSFYMAKKEEGGGALLDESHTVDFARWLFGDIEEVYAVNGKISHLEITSDDLAVLLVRFKGGTVGTIHMDIFGRAHRKDMEVMGEKGNIYWNFYDNEVRLYHADQKKWESFPFTCERNQMFMDEVKHFLACLEGKERPMVDGKDGLKTLMCLLAAQESARTKKAVSLN